MPEDLPEKDSEIAKMKVADLKKELKMRGLSVEGKKNELVERLQLAVCDSALLDDSGDLEDQDDLLDEDLSDDQLDSELSKEEMNIMEKKLGMDANSGMTDTAKEKTRSDQSKTAKKIILNRNPVAVDISITNQSNKENGEKKTNVEKSKIVKTASVDEKERLELRAAKFGVAMSAEAKKLARAERFGTTADSMSDKNTTTSAAVSSKPMVTSTSNTNIDMLKKRAERFGSTTPGCALEKVEIEERKKRRLERFGSQTTGSGTVQVMKKLSGVIDASERKKLRVERFKSC